VLREYSRDDRVVMTLDAGGTSFRFSALRGNRPVVETVTLPSDASRLERSLAAVVEGFERVRAQLSAAPVAISFAFPGPCDYRSGVVVAPPNLPAWRDVALGPMLEDRFSLPTFINNDGDLFVLGEATAGLLPHVNGLLAEAGSPKRFRNLFGVTLGTGFGAGLVTDGELYAGDNSGAAEIWLLRHKLQPGTNVEEGASIRSVRRTYAEIAGVPFEAAPDPRTIFDIAEGRAGGNRAAAQEAFRRLGEVVGDALSIATTLLDALVVVGGGISGAHPCFLPAIVAEMNSEYRSPDGRPFRRLVQRAFNLEDASAREQFLKGEPREAKVPGSERTVRYDALSRVGVGVSRLGTSEAAAVGAYAFALNRLAPAVSA
jgi:glucokinase